MSKLTVPDIRNYTMLELRGTDFTDGVLVQYVPELLLLQGTLECNSWHNNETTWTHTWQVVENVRSLLASRQMALFASSINSGAIGDRTIGELFAWANVLHDIAKPATQDIHLFEGRRRSLYPGHEAAGAIMARDILTRLRFSEKQIAWVEYIVRWHGDMHGFFGRPQDEFEEKCAAWKKAHPDHYEELFLHSWADTIGGYLMHTNPSEYHLRMDRYQKILYEA